MQSLSVVRVTAGTEVWHVCQCDPKFCCGGRNAGSEDGEVRQGEIMEDLVSHATEIWFDPEGHKDS